MNIRTYEILGKWIGNEHNVTIKFEPNCVPHANIESDVITMPTDIHNDNIYAALSTLMHEAGHLNYTKNDVPKGLIKDNIQHNVFNAIEDIRVDRKNMNRLWNIGNFYKESIPYDLALREKVDMNKVPFHQKVLINCIYEMEGLPKGKIKDSKIDDFIKNNNILQLIEDTIDDVEYHNSGTLIKKLENLINILGLGKVPRQPVNFNPTGAFGEGDGTGEGIKCETCGGTGFLKGDKDAKGTGAGSQGTQGTEGGGKEGEKCPICNGNGTIRNIPGRFGKGDEGFGSGQGSGDGSGNSTIGEIAMKEITKQRFKDLLNIKETKQVESMVSLNTDNITSFYTGDLESLFKDEKIVKKKKSKILLLLDGSGSMGCSLLDQSDRQETVGGCCKSLVEILKEVCEFEGLNVDYDIAGFTGDYHPFTKENWESGYARLGGGTDLINAFSKAQDSLLEDAELDGNKLIVVFTDGEVMDDEIKEMEDRITRHGADVRCMVIGVGANISSYFVKNICKDNNIIASESADQILMESIMTMLS